MKMFPEFPAKVLIYIISLSILWEFAALNSEVKFKLVSEDTVQSGREAEEDSYNYDHNYRDESYCFPCLCFRNMANISGADCTNRHLSGVPDGLPVRIASLNMSKNNLLQFNTASDSNYSLLTDLVVQFNSHLTAVIHKSAVNMPSQLTRLDLSHNDIQSIQDGSFRRHSNLKTLSLAGNRLRNITSDMFEGLNNLKTLNLSKNLITHLDNNTFDFLESLESLDLSRNKLSFTFKSIPLGSLEKLVNLKILYMQGNADTDQPYPIQALSRLRNLTNLYLDVNTLSKLGSLMKSLKKLTSLILGWPGYCKLRNITEDFLENTPYLTTFIISGCLLQHIDPLVYANVRQLETLEISNTSVAYDLYDAFDHLQGLVNSSLKTLRLIALSRTRYLCRTLGLQQAKYLQHISLEELDVSRNRIVLIGLKFVQLLPDTLKRLVLSDNKLTISTFVLTSLYSLKELSEIHLDRQDVEVQRSPKEVSLLKYTDFEIDETGSMNNTNYVYNISKGFHFQRPIASDSNSKTIICGCHLPITPIHVMKQIISFPPNLQIVKSNQFFSFDMYIINKDWKLNNSLKDITLSNNFLVTWGDGTLPREIQRADLSNNFANRLAKTFFQVNTILVSLNISNNILGESFAADNNGEIFKNLGKLQFLDISMNFIYKLPRRVFRGLTSLQILLASNNKLQILNVSLRHMSSLRFMNFSQNSITWIDQSTRDDLDILASTHTVQLDLSYNPLPCTCEGLPILQWMAYTNVNLVNQIYLRCQSEGGTMSDFGDLDARVTQVQRLCASRAIILVISISFSVVVVLFTSLALVYRFRWKIRYLRNIALARFVGFKPKNMIGEKFQYDAYIVYEDELLQFIVKDFVKELEVKRGHKLLLADRDIMPGTFMASTIFSAVQNSYKTVPVVTPDFYEGPYSEYAVKMAVMEEIYGQRQILHLCLYQPTDPEEMSKDLLSIMHRNHYTEYPPELDRTEDLVEHFWDQLSGCIQQNI
ncbi:hypothetical protein Btru_064097 [Bulinus truncatus]|nr:hypothetical protein Btru_064097 [Bulinus truncatus]